jgi:hypothetical protein
MSSLNEGLLLRAVEVEVSEGAAVTVEEEVELVLDAGALRRFECTVGGAAAELLLDGRLYRVADPAALESLAGWAGRAAAGAGDYPARERHALAVLRCLLADLLDARRRGGR